MVAADLISLLAGPRPESKAENPEPDPRDHEDAPIHAALIMDGNGRWASARELPRSEGHRVGAARIRPLVEAAPDLGIRHLTLFVFSADNWKRPQAEVQGILKLLGDYLRDEVGRCVEAGVRIQVLGRRDRLPRELVSAVEEAERVTRGGSTLTLRLAVDYSSREAMVDVLRRLACSGLSSERLLGREDVARALAGPANALVAPDVDLLIRTGGEQRLSDFLLWECAYAEFIFTETLWPDFGPEDVAAAVAEFRCRDRRFGRTPQQMSERSPVSQTTNAPPTELAG